MLVEQGFTTFDCADIYTGVEEFIGEFVKELKSSGTDDAIQIHTKYVPDINLLSKVDYAYTERIIDRSLKRLNREVLDVVQFHWWDYDAPGCLETAGHLSQLRDKGKIRHIGVTNFDTEHFSKIVEAGIPVASLQTQYSMFDRRPEKKLRDYCKKKGVALLCYGTLSGGFLSERWLGKTDMQPETRSQVKYMQVIEDTLGWDGFQELLMLLADIARKYGATISNVATQYILNQQDVGAAIVGVRNSRHTVSNAQTFAFTLDAADMKTICSYLDKYPILEGEPFELERTPNCKYRNIMKMNLNED
jgi:aryl-alcohol dehydrogenase-like predicted oxidoreductase